eukprot:CAMPEP_0116984662 /NCGR_PEP_ID=MMETSP0467-20121206/61750_1 /TAXON_ID=283647 /ORGANISM="Mesodinium pulex, Strain SPMC105" /LENGTH=136 /DNA_ID=CAMNT_0004679745 /DNA_START=461 /DNA_END=871 /DNA_ORIENTATION=+
MTAEEPTLRNLRLKFDNIDFKLVFNHVESVDGCKAEGRIAISHTSETCVEDHYAEAKKHNYTIEKDPVWLATPGKADVQVTILKDTNNIEICMIRDDLFNSLATYGENDHIVDWKLREDNWADGQEDFMFKQKFIE